MGKKLRGQGSVRLREDTKKYVIDYYDNLWKRHIETVGTNKRQAVDKLTEKMNQIRTGTYRVPGEEKGIVNKKAELRSIRIHDLRHTFTSILIAAGHNLKYIQNQMGHSSIKVTMDLYGHLMPEVFQGAEQKSEDFVFGNVMVTDKKEGVTSESQPLEMFGSGG